MRRILILFLFVPQLISAAPLNTVPPREHKSLADKSRAGTCVASSWHYEAVPGKFIGIWPPYIYWNKEALKNLKEKYGFSGIAIRQDEIDPDSMYQWAINAGFRPEKMMVIIAEDTYLSRVIKMPAAYYYLDEPVEHDCSGHATNGSHIYLPGDLQKRYDYIHANRPESKFVIGGYKRCSHLQEAVKHADNVMYSSYVNWSSMWLPVCHVNMGFGDDMEAPWSSGAGQQTDSWGDMHSKFGAKFSMSWMNGRGDEYDKLFPAANSMGLEGVWLYANQGLGADSAATLEQFCQAAVANGWLKTVDDYIPAPMNFIARKAQDGSSIELTWSDISDNEKGFVIERKVTGSDSYSQLAVIAAGCSNYTDQSVEEGKVYSYRIKAFNDYSSSNYSNESVISAPVVPHLNFPGDKAKGQPLKLNFNWNTIPDAESYSIMISEDGLFTTVVFSDSVLNKPQAEVSNLKDGREYYWKVSAKDSSGIKSYSSPGSFSTLLLSAANLKAEALSGRRIRLSWTDNSQSEAGYGVERKKAGEAQYKLLTTIDENATSFTDSLLSEDIFVYRIQAYNQICTSDYSNEASAAVISGVDDVAVVPVDYTLFQNHPNPYNPSTKISYTLPGQSRVKLQIYNSIGGVVRTLVDEVEDAGFYEFDFNASGLSSGIYFYLMEASSMKGSSSYRAARKMILLK
ncbi:MAG: fibronectin type III domain-containing protein [Acidobacteriota bacterium]